MEYDAFTGGVAPGGLRSKSDIRILICYMLKSVNAPLTGIVGDLPCALLCDERCAFCPCEPWQCHP